MGELQGSKGNHVINVFAFLVAASYGAWQEVGREFRKFAQLIGAVSSCPLLSSAGGGVARRAEAGEGAQEEEAKEAEGAQARQPPLLPNVRAREVGAPAREVRAQLRPRLY